MGQGIIEFKDNKEFREILAKRISGVGPLYIDIVDDLDNPEDVLFAYKRRPVSLNYRSCKMVMGNGNTTIVLERKSFKL